MIEIVFDGGFNDILLDYLDMQGRSSSDEDAFDYDASDDSSSGNDSDIVRAISADILRNGESIRCLGLRLHPPPHRHRRAPHSRARPADCLVTVSLTSRGTMQGSTLAVFRYPENPRFPDGIPDSPEQ